MKRRFYLIILLGCLTGIMAIGCGDWHFFKGEEEIEPARFLSSDPSEYSKISPGESVTFTFDKPLTELRVNGMPAEVSGTVARWKVPQGIGEGDQYFTLEWTDEDGNTGSDQITLTVLSPDITPPEVVEINVRDGAVDVDPDVLNREGIIIKFSEPIDTKKSKDPFTLAYEDGTALPWIADWSDDRTQAILLPAFPVPELELTYEKKYILIIGRYFDEAGNEGDEVRVNFATEPIEFLIPMEEVVGLWLFERGEGDVTQDYSGFGNDGWLKGNIRWVNGRIGKALEFKGDGEVRVLPSGSLNIGETLTVMAWVKLESNNGPIVSKERAYSLSLENGIVVWSQQGAKPKFMNMKPILPGPWTHIAFVYDFPGRECRLYINGELTDAQSVSDTIPISNGDFLIGGNGFKGTIDEVVLAEAALTEEDIRSGMEGKYRPGPE